jgi:hypothetical protein
MKTNALARLVVTLAAALACATAAAQPTKVGGPTAPNAPPTAAPPASAPSATNPAARPAVLPPRSADVESTMNLMSAMQKTIDAETKRMIAAPASEPAKVCAKKVATEAINVRNMVMKGVASGDITPSEVAKYKELETTRETAWAADMKSGYTEATCTKQLGLLTLTRNLVVQMSGPMSVPNCVDVVTATFKSMIDTYNNGSRAGKISAQEAAEFKREEAARVGDWEHKKKGGIVLGECMDHLRGLELQKARVEQMAR